MGLTSHTAAATTAVALGYLLAPPFSIAIDAITNALASFVAADNAKLSFVSPAMGKPGTLTKRQPDALSAYNDAVNNFKSILGKRREQINSNQRLPNLPGQAPLLGTQQDVERVQGPHRRSCVQNRPAQ